MGTKAVHPKASIETDMKILKSRSQEEAMREGQTFTVGKKLVTFKYSQRVPWWPSDQEFSIVTAVAWI